VKRNRAPAARSSRRLAARAAVKGVRLPDLEEFDTSGGLKIIFAERGPLPLITLQLSFSAGSATDPRRKQGLADFTASLLRRGTRKRDADHINEAVEFCGATLSCGADEDFLSIRITSPSEHLKPMLELLAELVRWPSFPKKEVESARRRLLAQLANELDDPVLLADRALLRALWGSHPYGHDVVGTARDVRGLTRGDAVAFHRARLGPKAALLVIVGEADGREVRALTERFFRGWSGGGDAGLVIPPTQHPVMAGQVLLVDKPVQTQSQVRLCGPGFPKGSPDIFAASLMNTVLGGSFTSRLMEAIRVNRGLSYGASSSFDRLAAGGWFSVSTFTKTETTRQIIDVALFELQRMRTGGPTAAELEAAKMYLGGLFPLRFETNDAVAAAIAEIRLYQLGDDWIERYRERLIEVTVEQARRMAKKYLLAESPALVVVGDAAAVKKQLGNLGPIKVVQATELQ
jgi:zinc protease